ncbi:MAG: TetR/AcrR family transcriptional regulator [Deltaproteobacteria bacterium]|nr:TetR/AcrR family transcriptional regulator [Deltaproteobacteria bacterium]
MDGRTLRAEARRENRRSAILEAALRTFGEKGFHQTTVADIIQAAGIARGTFYLYFEGKSAIFLELLDRLLVELRASIVGVDRKEGAPPLSVQLDTIVHRVLRTVADNRLLSTIIIREAVGLGDEVDVRLRLFYQKLLRYIRLALEEGRRVGLLRPIDTEVAAICVLGSVKQLMEQYVMAEDDHFDVDRAALAVLDFNLHGLLPSG